ncbi:MAG: hypothetical protein ABI691_11110 [Ginsengibacter sp.]
MDNNFNDAYEEIGKLFFYNLILSVDCNKEGISKHEFSSLWIKQTSIKLFNCIYSLRDLKIRIKQRMNEILTNNFYDRVIFTFSPSDIQYSKKNIIGKTITFQIANDNGNFKLTKVVDKINKHFDYSNILPLQL